MITRRQLSILTERMEEPRRFIQVLAGPRQVGKTTIIRQFLAECKAPCTSIAADEADADDGNWIERQWAAVRRKMRIEDSSEHILIIDEIQHIDNWSEAVKKEWDADTFSGTNIKVVLSGSSRLLLKDGLTESLMGRFELIRVPHWSYPEMKNAFGLSLEQYVYFGGYPAAASLIGDEQRWKSYIVNAIIAASIEKDVLMTKRVLKPALMRQLFEIGCSYSGELLSYQKIMGQLSDAGNATTLANYLNTLGEANLLCGIPKFAGDFARSYNSTPKFQVYNTALMSAYFGRGFKEECTDSKRWGRWVESAVGAHLVNLSNEYDYKVYYWRDRDDEVDFILKRHGGDTAAIEVKSGRRKENRGLRVFETHFHPQASMIVGSDSLPLELFLSITPDKLFLF